MDWDRTLTLAQKAMELILMLGGFAALLRWAAKIQDERLRAIVLWLIHAAEQAGGSGPEKKAIVEAELERRGFKADDAMIEGAVHQEFNSGIEGLALIGPAETAGGGG